MQEHNARVVILKWVEKSKLQVQIQIWFEDSDHWTPVYGESYGMNDDGGPMDAAKAALELWKRLKVSEEQDAALRVCPTIYGLNV